MLSSDKRSLPDPDHCERDRPLNRAGDDDEDAAHVRSLNQPGDERPPDGLRPGCRLKPAGIEHTTPIVLASR
jgi:hypothetical protein